MARKQSSYLDDLLSDDDGSAAASPSPASPLSTGTAPSPPATTPDRARVRGTTLLGRESALARVASGEVRQVTQLLLDPARVRVWSVNARSHAHLSEESCRELIDSLVAEGGQKVPAVVRRVEGDPDHDYEVIAGTRRHWSVSWLRTHSYPDVRFLAQVADLGVGMRSVSPTSKTGPVRMCRTWNVRATMPRRCATITAIIRAAWPSGSSCRRAGYRRC